MKSDTRTIAIDAPAQEVVEFVSDPRNLPRWAVGFAKGVRRDGERWVVATGAGELDVRIDADPRTGVVDFWMSPSSGVELLAASRVIQRGPNSEYVFTQFQPPGMSDDVFARNVDTLSRELTVLKTLMEVECPL